MPRERPRKNAVAVAAALPVAPRSRANNRPQVPFAYKLVLNQWLCNRGRTKPTIRFMQFASSVYKMAVPINRNMLCQFKILLLTRTRDFPIVYTIEKRVVINRR